MDTIYIVVGAILAFCGALVTLGNAYKTIKTFKQPYDDLKTKVLEIEESTSKLKEKMKAIEEKIYSYVDKKDSLHEAQMTALKEDILALKDQISKNEMDTKLILKQLLAIGGAIADPLDESQKEKVRAANSEIIEHLIEGN